MRFLFFCVVNHARVPVIETGEGNCHIYADSCAEIPVALDIIENAKLQKPGACNAVETLLVHRDILPALMPLLAARLAGKAELRCDGPSKAAICGDSSCPPAGLVVKDALKEDWGEFGFGAELGISTQKFHVRGPMGPEALTTIKYLVSGSGQIRD
jgi:glutamate-5-semialdehyde dehydrogenase